MTAMPQFLCRALKKHGSLEQCREIVLDAFVGVFAEDARIPARFFSENWIPAPLLPDNGGGGFAHPWVPKVIPNSG